jgi:hypothetical protein
VYHRDEPLIGDVIAKHIRSTLWTRCVCRFFPFWCINVSNEDERATSAVLDNDSDAEYYGSCTRLQSTMLSLYLNTQVPLTSMCFRTMLLQMSMVTHCLFNLLLSLLMALSLRVAVYFATHTRPVGTFAGSDSLTYTVSDGQGNVNVGQVDSTVTAVNDAPDSVATDDSASMFEDRGSLTVNRLCWR